MKTLEKIIQSKIDEVKIFIVSTDGSYILSTDVILEISQDYHSEKMKEIVSDIKFLLDHKNEILSDVEFACSGRSDNYRHLFDALERKLTTLTKDG